MERLSYLSGARLRYLPGAIRKVLKGAPDVDEPLLLKQLWMVDSDENILAILDTDCDVNVQDLQSGTTPLHLAVYRKTTTVAHKLIEKGADLNARDYENVTPLHCAIKCTDSNYATAYLLLYYGADVTSKCCKHLHPFVHSLFKSQIELALILSNYNNLNHMRNDINMFVRNSSDIFYSLPYDLFKDLWPLIDYQIIRNVPGFFLDFLEMHSYPNTNWIECLYEIMDSQYALEIMMIWEPVLKHNDFMHKLLCAFKKRNLDSSDQINIIYKYLSTGVRLYVSDISSIYQSCGFGEELEAVLYCGEICDWKDGKFDWYYSPIERFILIRDPDNVEYIFINCIKSYYFNVVKLVRQLNFFSFSRITKEKLFDACKELQPEESEPIVSKIVTVPEIPSLVEICRKVIRTSLRQRQFVHLYQFYDNVKQLGVPQKIIDIIIFKSPIYS